MDSRKLQYFVEVAASCSFTKAAEKLLVAQPAISKAIQKLEEELQLTLFDRSEKSIVLTPEGSVLLAYARSILSQFDDARREMEEMRRRGTGEIRLGVPSILGSSYFATLLKEFNKLHPRLTVSVVEEGTDQIRKMIERKEVDFGILADAREDEDFIVTPLLTDEAVACVSSDHPLSHRRFVTLDELLNEPLILFREDDLHRKLLLEASKKTAVEPSIAFTANQYALVRSLVAEGMGVTVLLRMSAKFDDRLRTVQLDPFIPMHLGIGHKRNHRLPQACQAFIEFLQRKLHERKGVLLGMPLQPWSDIYPAKREGLA